MIWWGDFIKDLKFYSTSNDYNYCECEVKNEKKEIDFVYKIHASTM